MTKTASGSFTGVTPLKNRLIAFWQCESGAAMTFIALIWTLMMLVVSGLAIDLARAEHLRVKIQNTLDRAILAASDIDQTLDPRDVVMDYFVKAGLGQYISRDDITVETYPDRAGRTVRAQVSGSIKTSTMSLSGIERIGAPAAAAAEETVSDREIVMVLDVSGSMGRSNRMVNLKAAAQDFVTDIFADAYSQDQITIGIVPYAGQVNVGPTLMQQYNISGEHTYGNCVDFPAALFGRVDLAPGAFVLPRADVFDPWSGRKEWIVTDTEGPYCPQQAGRQILPPSIDPGEINAHIRGFNSDGNTSIDIGMKWGAALIDPTFRDAMSGLISAGEVNPNLAGRPFDYRVVGTQKFIIVMSDGKNTDEHYITEEFATGESPIFVDDSGRISIHHPGERADGRDYYQFNNNRWRDTPYGGSDAIDTDRLNWPDVWATYSINWIAKELYDDPLGWNNAQRQDFIERDLENDPNDTGIRDAIKPAEKNRRTDEICTAVKAQGVTVFAIAFEAPSEGVTALRDCASEPKGDYFHQAQGSEIEEVFDEILRQIKQLRLTQ